MVKPKYKKRDPQRKKELIKWRTDQILNAAMKVFARCGFEGTDVEDIAALAGVGKGTIYRYFKSKGDLFFSVLEWGMDTLHKRVVGAIGNTKGSMEKLKAALSTYLGFFEENRDFYRVLILEKVEHKPREHERMKKKHLSGVRFFENILKEGVREGVFRKIKVDSVAYALWGTSNALLLKWLLSEKKYPLKEEISVMEEIYCSGILKNRK
ncbi:MAG: TetR/AcrR family transcriptional regulator [candidate division Zixibacteria bacterium]|nr:TetR/AcrR family transcriptional regulator [candidate division Zixibacteria bacterium]